ncbi:MAG: DUF3606 domain-containing protein [Comamonadaceae bacterium]|nr:MAG: DUF3606 domain-containing protein [Comamonadaceae bacterium]
MTDDRTKRGGQDRKRIDASEGYEVQYWTRQLGCTEQQLRTAIAAVGPQVEQVRAYLQTDHRSGGVACI